MKITVVGCGAIGGLFSSVLHSGGHDVTCVEINKDYVEAVRKNGLSLTRGDNKTSVKFKITDKIEEGGTPDLVVLAVKSYDNVQAGKDVLKVMGPDTTVMTVQNGVGNVETFSEILGKERIITGTTTFGSTVLGPGVVNSSPTGAISLGELDGGVTPRLKKIIEAWTAAGIEMHEARNVHSLIWTKLLVNVGINAIGALTCLTNGQILDYPSAESVQDMAVDEGVAVAEVKGIQFATDDIRGHVKDVCRSTFHNKASMYQDIERGSRTEVRSINGAIVEEGKKYKILTPVNDVLTKLIIAREGRA